MKLRTALLLGRVSNLPTVWTNAATGWTLAGGWWLDGRLLPVLLATSLMYLGGMYLNDAFDARIDAAERPGRPIPSGVVSLREVALAGSALLAAGLLVLAVVGLRAVPAPDFRPLAAGVALVATILYYDWRHKRDPLSPFWMGLCRVLVYVVAAAAAVRIVPGAVAAAALVLLSYLVGLTFVAKQETLSRIASLWPLAFLAVPLLFGAARAGSSPPAWLALGVFAGWLVWALSLLHRRRPGDIPRAVAALIAGISLLDAVFLALAGAGWPLLGLVLGAFLLTRAWQRHVPGT